MAEHTPGPWKRDAVFGERLLDIVLDYEVSGAGSPVVIGTAFGDDLPPPGITLLEAAANARLMAAAPDLLAACRQISGERSCYCNVRRPNEPVGHCAVCSARAALATVVRK